MTTTTAERIGYDHPQWEAFKDAARRLVNGFSAVPQDWLKLVAEHIDNDECVAFPMWGTLFIVNDSADAHNIRDLLKEIEPDDSEDYGVEREDYGAHLCEGTDEDDRPLSPDRVECQECGLVWCDRCDPAPSALCHACHGRGYTEAPLDDFDEDGFNEAVREAWRESGDERAYLADSGWQSVSDTGIIAREFDDHLVLGVHGAGYDFYESHWVPLYQALGYSWHGEAK